jgi:subtilisin family serine protease
MVYRAVIRPLAIGVALATSLAIAIPTVAEAASPPTTPSGGYKGGNVIVVLKDQHSDLAFSRGSSDSPRAKAFRSDQSSLIDKAKSQGAKALKGFGTVNAVAATVTPAQEATLAADPSVADVVPDLPLKGSPVTTVKPGHGGSAPVSNSQICPSDPTKPLLEPEALQTTNTAFSNAATPQAQSIVDGTGTKVAFIADGIDINNPDFIRADGSHVFVDYQDFSGEGPNAPSSAAEAFGDASAIAAQGRQTYDLSQFVSPAHPLPTGCDIQIRGMAPGASLIGLKVFGNADTAPTSRFIEAIDYAVKSGADVLNESFGGNPYPDTTDDPITLADEAAIAAGVTVVSSTGDAGVTGTVGSPASSGQVIGVAATTTFRSYAQTTGGGFQFSNGTWANDNISGLSSGGTTSSARVPDLSAPGDSGWALCTPDTDTYEDCVSDGGDPSAIQDFGGTSQSSPLTAGAAALVIEAYKNTHGGAKPTPAVVKQILTSTARDLGHPASEQGAGELDSLKAVQAAMSWKDANGSGTPAGSALTVDQTQLSASTYPNLPVAKTITVTNRGTKPQTVTAGTRALTQTVSDVHGSFDFSSATAPTYVDAFGILRSYAKFTFTVAPNVDHLTVLAAANSTPGAPRTILIDPKGTFAAYSIPQGAGNAARSEVRTPMAGTWTAYFAVPQSAGFTGPVAWEAIQQRFGSIGAVLPSSFTLAPGASRTVAIVAKEPSSAGDLSASVQLTGSVSGATSVPLTLRAVIPPTNYSFKASVSGGNGRQSIGEAQVYYLDVPRGARDLGVGLTPSDTGNLMGAVLTGPDGQSYSWNTNYTDGTGIQDYVRAPKAGRWLLSVQVFTPVSGVSTQSTYNVAVRYNTASASAPSLPTSVRTKLAHGKTVTVPVRVTNTGVAPLAFFADPRLNKTGTIGLANVGSADTIPLPQTSSDNPSWLIPTHTSGLAVTADGGDQPVNLDINWEGGDPEDYSAAPAGGGPTTVQVGNGATSTVTAGFWYANIGQTGPFGDAGAPAGSVTLGATATSQLFDTDVATSTGDYQSEGVTGQSASSPVNVSSLLSQLTGAIHSQSTSAKPGTHSAPVVNGIQPLAPGQSETILVKITPQEAKGSVVSGHLYIDTVDPFTGNSDELVDLPYTYTVG